MENNIKLSAHALSAILNLQHSNGTYHYYRDALSRMMAFVLHFSDEVGMSDREAMSTLRALHSIREDLGYIAGNIAKADQDLPADWVDPAEVATRVEAAFSMAGDLDPDKGDTPASPCEADPDLPGNDKG